MAPVKPVPGWRRTSITWRRGPAQELVRVVVQRSAARTTGPDSDGDYFLVAERQGVDAMGDPVWSPVGPDEEQRILAEASLVAWARAKWERQDETVDDLYERSSS